MACDKQVKLVIIDSMAALLRSDFWGKDSNIRRTELLGQQSSLLKLIAERQQIVILVTNQVTTVINNNAGGQQTGNQADKPGGGLTASNLQAALGVAWAHAVNTRLQLEVSGSCLLPPCSSVYVVEGAL